MNKAFFINGGAGRVLCSIPALERHAETHDDFIIVSESWSELYLNSKVIITHYFNHWFSVYTEKLSCRYCISISTS